MNGRRVVDEFFVRSAKRKRNRSLDNPSYNGFPFPEPFLEC